MCSDTSELKAVRHIYIYIGSPKGHREWKKKDPECISEGFGAVKLKLIKILVIFGNLFVFEVVTDQWAKSYHTTGLI